MSTRSLVFPPTIDACATGLLTQPAVLRAGGTDLFLRQRTLPAEVVIHCLRDVREPVFRSIREDENGWRLGAGIRIAEIGEHRALAHAAPALVAAAATLATPQVRAVATLGGNLVQEVRCPYFRDHAMHCLRKGGAACLAREGVHDHHSAWDLGACLAPSPSTLACALLAEGAVVVLRGAGGERTVEMADLFGDGSDPKRGHRLQLGELVVECVVPNSGPGAVHGGYRRLSERALGEWPAVEVAVRLEIDGVVRSARVVAGAVAAVPLRLQAVESELIGTLPTAEVIRRAADRADYSAPTVAATSWKRAALPALVEDTLLRALESA